MQLTPTVLKKIMPGCAQPAKWTRPLNDAMTRFEINTPRRQAAFLAQVAYESHGLNKLEENLNYAPGRLPAVWPKRFPDANMARPYSRNPEKLANAVYASRLGNGDEASRDGYRFRGRGLIQVTGRDNYKRIGEFLEIDLINMPDTLLEPRYAALSAATFWHLNRLNSYADDGDVNEITQRVSGSRVTADERKKIYALAMGVLDNEFVIDSASEARPSGAPSASSPPVRPQKAASPAGWFE